MLESRGIVVGSVITRLHYLTSVHGVMIMPNVTRSLGDPQGNMAEETIEACKAHQMIPRPQVIANDPRTAIDPHEAVICQH